MFDCAFCKLIHWLASCRPRSIYNQLYVFIYTAYYIAYYTYSHFVNMFFALRKCILNTAMFVFFFTHTHCILFLQEINRLTPSIAQHSNVLSEFFGIIEKYVIWAWYFAEEGAMCFAHSYRWAMNVSQHCILNTSLIKHSYILKVKSLAENVKQFLNWPKSLQEE